MNKLAAIVRARTDSSRLPDKVFLSAAGKTMLEHTVDRIGASQLIDRVIVATTESRADDRIAAICREIDTPCFRGSAVDVLDRIYQCAKRFHLTDISHFGADNPLVDPDICDLVISEYFESDCDYVTNNFPPTFPDGLEVEITPISTLERLWKETSTARHREHIFTYIWDQPARFKIINVEHHPNLHHQRWTLDFPSDYRLIKEVFDVLYPTNPRFGMNDVVAFLSDQPGLSLVNVDHLDEYLWR